MTNIAIKMVRPNYYQVIADTERFGKQEIMFEGINEAECVLYIKKNGGTYESVKSEIKLVNDAISEIVNKVPNILIDNIKFRLYDMTWKGLYEHTVILLNPKTYTKETIVHEIGHYIHEKYFNNKLFRFGTDNKTKYAKTNKFENFAECFTQYINGEKCKRTERMKKILETI